MNAKQARRIRYWILAAREDMARNYDIQGRRLRAGHTLYSRPTVGGWTQWPDAYSREFIKLAYQRGALK